MKIEHVSAAGRDHQNEDAVLFKSVNETSMAIAVADGMGGKSFGSLASSLVCQSIIDYATNAHSDNTQELLFDALEHADRRISIEIEQCKQSMGAAVLAAIISSGQLHYTWQGNVRLYRHNQGQIICLTHDHTIDIGYGEERLTRCIKGCGLREDVPYEVSPIEVGDVLYICTDGFYRQFQDKLKENLSMTELNTLLDCPDDDSTLVCIEV